MNKLSAEEVVKQLISMAVSHPHFGTVRIVDLIQEQQKEIAELKTGLSWTEESLLAQVENAYGNMEGCDGPEFIRWEKVFNAWSVLLEECKKETSK